VKVPFVISRELILPVTLLRLLWGTALACPVAGIGGFTIEGWAKAVPTHRLARIKATLNTMICCLFRGIVTMVLLALSSAFLFVDELFEHEHLISSAK
jgi:hypothetical protein